MSMKTVVALDDILEVIKSLDEFKNDKPSNDSERDHLLPKQKDSIVSLSDSDSSDDEFDDIIPKQRTQAHTAHHEKKVTNTGTILHLLKANISTGLLAMPKAMSHFGLLAGILGLLILGSLYIYCIHLLLDINRAVVRRVMIDRKINELKETLEVLCKEQKKLQKKERKKLKKAAGCKTTVNASINSTNWEKNYAADIEVGESSAMPSNSNKQPKGYLHTDSTNWKKNYAADIEVGESSAMPSNSNKKENAKDIVIELRESSSEEDNPNKISKLEETEDVKNNVKKPSASNQDNSDSISELEETDVKNNEVEEPSVSNEDKSNRDPQEENYIDLNEILFKQTEAMILRTLDYPKLVELSFHYGMKSNKWAAKCFKFYVQILMLFTHIGCCCVCFLFAAESLGEMATKGPFLGHTNSFQMVAYAVPIMICLSFIPDRHELTGVTTIAFLLQLCGVVMLVYVFFTGEHSTSLDLYIAPAETWYLYFGIIFYAFEGTGVTLHLESHMEKKQDFRGWNGILNKSMFFIIPLYVVFGGLGYWKFGNDVKTSVTFNLPENRISDLIQVMMVLGVLLTYPFHLSFVLTPIKKFFILDHFNETTKNIWDLVLRTIFVVFTFIMSALTPYLELQLTVLGAVASCFLILVVPPFMSLNSYLYLPDLNYSNCRLIFHLLIFIIGVSGTGLGSYTVFKNLHLYYPNSTIFG